MIPLPLKTILLIQRKESEKYVRILNGIKSFQSVLEHSSPHVTVTTVKITDCNTDNTLRSLMNLNSCMMFKN
jgi:hypothetical protein